MERTDLAISLLLVLPLAGFALPQRREPVAELVRTVAGAALLHRASVNKWWFDDLNDLLSGAR